MFIFATMFDRWDLIAHVHYWIFLGSGKVLQLTLHNGNALCIVLWETGNKNMVVINYILAKMHLTTHLSDHWYYWNIIDNIYLVLGGFYFLNCVLNPILYSVMSERFRRAFMDMYREMTCFGLKNNTAQIENRGNMRWEDVYIVGCNKKI